MNCNLCQEQLLHYLYDVLDPEERSLLVQHLESCTACQAARDGLRAQQELLSEAAKESFSEITFQTPSATPRRFNELTQILPRRQRGFSLVRVAVAAAILLFVAGGGSIGVVGWFRTKDSITLAESRVKESQQKVEEHQQEIQKHQQRTQEEMRAIQEQINRLFGDWTRDADQQRKQLKDKTALKVQAPRNFNAGAKIPVVIDLPNLAASRAGPAKTAKALADGARGQISVVDQNKKMLYQADLKNVQGNNRVNLPPLPLEPGNNYTMVTEMLDRDGKVLAREELNLSAPEYLTHLMTDRPMYRPGEVVRFRSLTLDRFSLKPAEEDLQLVYQVLGPNQQEVFKLEGAATLVNDGIKEPLVGPDGKVLRGLGAGDFPLPLDIAGGQYTLSVSEVQNRFPPEKRSFLVNQWQMPRMNKEVKFHRSSYGPDEIVELQATAKRAEGGAPLALQPVRVRASVDGQTPFDAPLQTDFEGKVRVAFKLPPAERLPLGVGSVSVEFNDGAGPETIVRTIPIVLNRLLVEFFPEGGDLVQGVSNRVYFQARNTLGKPAELKGRIVDQQGNAVAAIETLHDDQEEGINQGQGSFAFTPVAGKKYELRIDAPIGVQGKHPLPATKAEGVVLHLLKPLADEAIELELTSADTQRLLMVGAYCRGKLLDQRRIGAPAGKPVPVTLKTEPGVSGVYRVTVYEIIIKGEDIQFVPRAERLTYRRATEQLNVACDGVKSAYVPGDKVNLKFRAENENKAKTPAVASVCVVDLGLIKLADDKTERGLPTHFLLTSEIRRPEDLENADVLVGTHPKAAQALDLLLGTQGWRRFAEQDPQRFQQQHQRDAQRVLAAVALPNLQRDSIDQIVTDKVDKGYAAKAVKMLDQMASREAEEKGPLDAGARLQALQESRLAADRNLSDTQASLREYEHRLMQYFLGSLVIIALFAGIWAIALGVRRLGEGRSALAALVTGTALLLFLFMGSLAGVFYMIGSRGEMPLAWNRERDAAVFQAAAAQKAAPPMMAPVNAPMDPAPAAMDKMEFAQGADPKVQVEMAKGAMAQADALPVAALAKEAPPRMMPARPNAPVPPALGVPGGPQVRMQNVGPGPGGLAGAQPPNGQLGQPGFAGLNQFNLQQGQGGFGGGGGNFGGERELRQQKNYQEIFRRRMARAIELPPELPPLVVREYAHQHFASQDHVRRDFTETVCWRPALVLPGGVAEVSFDLSDAVTRYQVTVFSHSLDGRLGADRFELAARLPFSIDPKVPFEISNTDKIILPVAIKNDMDNEGRVELTAKAFGMKTQDPQTRELQVGPKERARGYFTYEPSVVTGDGMFRVKGTFDGARGKADVNINFTDTVERSFKIVPEGFPINGSASGLLEKAAVHDINLPNTWVAGTLQCQVQVFPSTLAELQKGLEGLLREPCGCFEQSSSSNYPNVLILNYLQEAGQGDPNIEKRARGLLQSGYQKLTSFECIDPTAQAGAGGDNRRGYEWFGQTAPPHEALTAYGLLQFRDMAKIYPVDAAMVERTTKYLLAQRDGQGGFKRNARALDSFGRAPDHITSAYLVWALTDSGVQEDLTKELTALGKKAEASKDPYFVALVALGHLGRAKAEDGLAIAKQLRDAQKDDGHLEGTETSITGSQGRDLHLETTALAVLAWLKANRPEEFHANVQKAVKWISAQRSGQGSFGATQSTILALKALIAHTRDAKKIAEDGKLTIALPERGPKAVGETSFTAGAAEPITLTLHEGKGLQPGKNKVLVEITGKNTFPYTLSWSYQTLTPPSDDGCQVKLSTQLNKNNAQEGDTVKLKATIENVTDKGHGMAVAILGLPAGLALPEDAKQLKELAKLRDDGAKPGTISAWELRGRELVLYWRDLAPKAKIDVELDLICRLPGTYRGPASRAYLYYNADRKHWLEPLAIVIDPQRVE